MGCHFGSVSFIFNIPFDGLWWRDGAFDVAFCNGDCSWCRAALSDDRNLGYLRAAARGHRLRVGVSGRCLCGGLLWRPFALCGWGGGSVRFDYVFECGCCGLSFTHS